MYSSQACDTVENVDQTVYLQMAHSAAYVLEVSLSQLIIIKYMTA